METEAQKNQKMTSEEIAKAIKDGDNKLSEFQKKIDRLRKDRRSSKKTDNPKKEKSLTPEQIKNLSPQELYEMGYSVHSKEITDAIKRKLQKEVWDERDAKNKKKNTENKQKADTESESSQPTSPAINPENKKDEEPKAEQAGSNTKRGPEPKKEGPTGDPYIAFLKTEINQKLVELNDLKNKIESLDPESPERKILQAKYDALNKEVADLQKELLTYRKKSKEERNKHNKSYDTKNQSQGYNAESNNNTENNSGGGPNGPRNPYDGQQNTQTNNNAGGPRNPENGPTPESQFKIKLDELRDLYTNRYKGFYKEKNKKMGLMNKIRRGVGMSIKNEEPIPEDLINLKSQYEKALFEYGNDLYNQESTRLAGQNLPPNEFKSQLAQYKSEIIFKDIILDEEQRLSAQKVEDLPKKEKSAMRSFLTWYASLNPVARKALSIGVFTGIGVAAIAGFGAGAGVAAAWGGAKVLRSATGAFVGEGAAYAIGKMATGKINKAKEFGTESSKNILGNLNWDENTFAQAKEQYQATLNQHADKMNSLRKKQMAAKIIAGGLTTFALNYEDAFIHKPSSSDLLVDKDGATGSVNNTGSETNTGSGTNTESEAIAEEPKAPAPDTKIENSKIIKIKPFKVEMRSDGALATVQELKKQISAMYPNMENAPANIKHIAETDTYTLTKEWGMFAPDDTSGKESAMMLKGSSMSIDENGKITLNNLGKGETVLSGEGASKYTGEMFDSDHSDSNTIGNGNKEFDINQAPEEGYTKLTEGEFNINETPEGLSDPALADLPTSNSTPEEILRYMQDHPNTVVRDPNTGLPYNPSDLYEKTSPAFITQNGHEIHLSNPAYEGHSVIMGGDHRIYVDGNYSNTLTEEFLKTKSSVVDETTARWFSWSRKGETYPEWKALNNKSMTSLANPDHDFANAREERLFEKMLKLSKKEGISYQGKTMAQLVDEVAMKRMEQVG